MMTSPDFQSVVLVLLILDDIDRRVTLGAVSEVDANKEKAKATEKLIDSLLDLEREVH